MKPGWEIKTLREVCKIKPPKGEARDRVSTSSLVSFLPMEDLGIHTKFVRPLQTRTLSDVVGSYTYFADGDVLLAKITPCFENGKLGIADGLTNGIGFGSSEYIVFRPGETLTNEWLYYYLSRDAFRVEGAARMSGAVGHKRVAKEFIESYPMPVAPLPEQKQIVSLLDQAFDDIDTAKTNAEKNIENARTLFESHLQFVFNQRGADWNRLTLDSLLERGWIESHLDGNHGGDYPRDEEFVSEGVPYISATCLVDDRVDTSRAKYLSPSRAALLRKGIAKDHDVLFAHNATVGPVAILRTDEERVILGTSLTYYRCNPEHILPEYLAHYMRSFGFKTQYLQVMRQSTRNQVPITKQREFFHIIPPLDEQKRIVIALDGLFENAQHLSNLYERKLAALDALRESLLQQAFSGELAKGSRQSAVVSFPTNGTEITKTDLHAGVLAIGYALHEKYNRQKQFGHVKAEKIAHMVEAHTGIDLGRSPIKDAAGPNDYAHLLRVEHRARKAGYFDFKRIDGAGYRVKNLGQFDALVKRARDALGGHNQAVDDLIALMLPMNTQQAEIFATVYAAWNNLLLDGQSPTNEEIVFEARENWHPAKLSIPRAKFFAAIAWLREKGIVPGGKGKKVSAKQRKQ